MGTQYDSIDISQMKAFALGLTQEEGVSSPCTSNACRFGYAGKLTPSSLQSEHRDLQAVTTALQQRDDRQVSLTLPHGHHANGPIPNSQPYHTTLSQPWFGIHPQPPQRGLRVRAQRFSASQPELPSTIPESLRSKMLSSGSQSQGDTQPVSQWVYEEFTNRSNLRRAMRSRSEVNESTIIGGDDASHSIQQGQIGHVDLLGTFDHPSNTPAAGTFQDHLDDDHNNSSQVPDIEIGVLSGYRRFEEPETPAPQNRKRKRGSEITSQETETSSLPVNPFAGQMGNVDGLMNPSQLFKATQAMTSPLANVIPSDGLSDRPSPDIQNLERPSAASTPSSPARLSQSGMLCAVKEPQTTYVSMKESQEVRERMLQAMRAEQHFPPEYPSDDDFGSPDTQLRKRLNQKRISMEAKAQFAGLTARSELVTIGPSTGRGGRTRTTNSRDSPQRMGKEVSQPVVISDDAPPEDDPGNTTEDETEREDEMENQEEDDIDELGEDNKENVEVPRTDSRVPHAPSQVISSQPTPSHRRLRKPKDGFQSRRAIETDSSPNVDRSQGNPLVIGNGTQLEAIADSQPSQAQVQDKQNPTRPRIRAFSEPRSSLDARILVPQSQSSEASRILRSINVRSRAPMEKASSQGPSSSPTKTPFLHQDKVFAGHSLMTRFRDTGEGTMDKALLREGTSIAQLPSSLSTRRDRSARIRSMTIRHRNSQEPTDDISNLMPSPRATPKSTSQPASSLSVAEQSRPSTLFETAREHLSTSPSRFHIHQTQQKSRSQPAYSMKHKPPRSISEIAADPSPPDILADVDVDIDILSNEDVEFQRALSGSSPIAANRVRWRGGRRTAVQDTKYGNTKPPPLPKSPVPPPSSAFSAISPAQLTSKVEVSTSAAANAMISQSTGQDTPLSTATEISALVQASKPRAISKSNSVQEHTAVVAKAKLIVADSTSSAQPSVATPRSTIIEANGRLPIVAPNRVFAHFNGTTPAYHPATCLRVNDGDEPRYTIRFDDGTVDSIPAYSIKRLELRIGDQVKLDLPGSRTKTYIVVGMCDPQRPATPPDLATPSRRGLVASTNDSAFPETDVHGYATVLVSPKQRTCIEGNQPASSQIAVPIAKLYLTQTLWASFKNRQYTHIPSKPPTLTGLQTPSERPSTPSTPSSRTRRAKPSGPTLSRSMTTSTRSNDGMFKNMVFAITNVGRAEDSERLKAHISSNGGTILDNGFDELFHIPPLPRTTGLKDPSADDRFELILAAKTLGFTCLIADKYCRRAKYVQALALGIPCLATRWITDCVTKQRVIPWGPYLLPSGESSFLGGAVRSRILQPFAAETSTLSDIVENRPKMLHNASVLLIMEKNQEETMKQHPLITHALGAGKIARAINEDAAIKAVSDGQALGEPWDWVFSYDREKAVEDRLFGTNQTGKKRKRGREIEAHAGLGREKRVKTRVVGNEFVIQSLILGMLVEE
ncbi:hypothetical protein N7G274_006549 [Stereocaulon virgatum]|uniref:BRCT domain-containing protein n=1 Tax=Stereocaulon virgatum TaxID=373712 RepID=A0ABR4A555_9LECA